MGPREERSGLSAIRIPAALVRRLLSEDYADKVIVTTIQKLGLALDENSKRNRQRTRKGQPTYKEQLEALQDGDGVVGAAAVRHEVLEPGHVLVEHAPDRALDEAPLVE